MSTDAPNIEVENRSVETENRSAATAFAGKARYVASPANVDSRPGFFAQLPWTMLMIVVGFITVAACVYVPLREENRLSEYELANLASQAKYVQNQVDANASFIERVHIDPTLTHRLVMRMTNKPIPGTAFLEAQSQQAFNSSPFELTRVPTPDALPAYRSDLPAVFGPMILDFRSRLVLLCAGIFLMGAAVILGTTKEMANEKAPSLS